VNEAPRLAAITAFLLKHRASPLFRRGHTDTPDESRAEEFVTDLEALGPTFVKVGQTLSTRPDIVPPAYLAALARLQDKAQPAELGEIEAQIEKELGAPPRKLFKEFDPVPVGTASFAQVHSAVLPSGRRVAVKVQRPNLHEQVQTDLASLRRLIASAGLVGLAPGKYGFAEWLDEFQAAMLAELDYLQEAENLETFRKRLVDYPNILVPAPIWDYTTSRVLTMELAQGIRVTDIPDVLRTEVDLDPLAGELGRAYLDQIFMHGLIHADPHPGNMLLTPEHQLVLLDLGMVGHVPPRMRDQLLKLVLATVEGRGEQAAETFMHMGTRLEEFDEPRFTREISRKVSRFSNAEVGVDSEGEVLLDMIRVAIDCGLKPPTELTLLAKTLLNLESVMLALDREVSIKGLLRDHMEKLFRARAKASLDIGRMATDALDVQELLREAPPRLAVLLRTLADNRFRVHIAGLEEARLIEGIQKVANRITAGLISAAMIVGAALIMDIRTGPELFGYPALALVMFLMAAILGATLVVLSLMGDRKAPPKAEKDPV
jgi:ubiquinone biosynthesis protein